MSKGERPEGAARRAFLTRLAALAAVLRLQAAPGAQGAQAASGAAPTLVIGASGRLGSLVIKRLAAEGRPVRALLRPGRDAHADLPPSAEIAAGDVRDAASLRSALAGCERVLFAATATAGGTGENTPQTVDYGGVVSLVEAATSAIRQVVLVSSSAVTQPLHPHNMWKDILLWKLRGEEQLRRSGFPYTVLRPTGMRNYPGGIEGIGFSQGDRFAFGYVISREDMASVCAAAVGADEALGKTFECYNSPQIPVGPVAPRFAALLPDLR